MEIHSFSTSVAKRIDQYHSKAFSYTEIVKLDGHYRIGCAWLGSDGLIGEHPAGQEQLLLVVAGSALVSGTQASSVEVGPGSAVLWNAGEVHKTRAGEAGLVAIIVQGDGLGQALEINP